MIWNITVQHHPNLQFVFNLFEDIVTLNILVALKITHFVAPFIKNILLIAAKEIDLLLLYSHIHKHFLLKIIIMDDMKYLEYRWTLQHGQKIKTNWDFRKKATCSVMMHSERSLVTFPEKWLDFCCCNYSNVGQGEIQPFSFLNLMSENCIRDSRGITALPSLFCMHSWGWR